MKEGFWFSFERFAQGFTQERHTAMYLAPLMVRLLLQGELESSQTELFAV